MSDGTEAHDQDVRPQMWFVSHTREGAHANEDRFIGLFDSERTASEVVAGLSAKPGFRDSLYPARVDSLQGFIIDPYSLDVDHCREGFHWEHDPPSWMPADTFEAYPVDDEPDAFLVEHRRHVGSHSNVWIIGVYSSFRASLDAVYRLMPQPGYRAFPQGFTILGIRLNVVHWAEGFNDHDTALKQLLTLSPQTFPPK